MTKFSLERKKNEQHFQYISSNKAFDLQKTKQQTITHRRKFHQLILTQKIYKAVHCVNLFDDPFML